MNPLPAFLTDLAQSKKFKALVALVALWSEPVRSSLGLDQYALKWLTLAFGAYFISQAFRDFGEEVNKAVKSAKGEAEEADKEEKK